jgi:hypothetical protein
MIVLCQHSGVPCATGTTPNASVEARLEQGFRIVITPPTRSLDDLYRGRQATGRDTIFGPDVMQEGSPLSRPPRRPPPY